MPSRASSAPWACSLAHSPSRQTVVDEGHRGRPPPVGWDGRVAPPVIEQRRESGRQGVAARLDPGRLDACLQDRAQRRRRAGTAAGAVGRMVRSGARVSAASGHGGGPPWQGVRARACVQAVGCRSTGARSFQCSRSSRSQVQSGGARPWLCMHCRRRCSAAVACKLASHHHGWRLRGARRPSMYRADDAAGRTADDGKEGTSKLRPGGRRQRPLSSRPRRRSGPPGKRAQSRRR